MIRIKLSVAILAAVFTISALGSSSAQAQQRHWFYNDYDRYDERAYYDDEDVSDEDDEYAIYAPLPRHIQRRIWRKRQKRLRQQRLRRWARQNRRINRATNRPERRRLYDAPQYGSNRNAPLPYAPSTRQAQPPQSPLKLAYVPYPRTKPYHLIPPALATKAQPGKKISLANKTKPGTFDERPTWNATPEKPVSKKAIKITTLPKITAPTPAKTEKPKTEKAKAKTPTARKPIRIKVVKSRKPAQPRHLPPLLATNQLSCDKAKTIVSDFGFSNVTPQTCTGTVYNFNAKRDGKPYSVKVSSLSGELKGVKQIK